MVTTSKEIIDYLNKYYPQTSQDAVRNCTDEKSKQATEIGTRYIIGVVQDNNYRSPGFSEYKAHIERRLKNTNNKVHVLRWGYTYDEKADMIISLNELGKELSVDLNAQKMIDSMNISKDGSGMYDIVVTVVVQF